MVRKPNHGSLHRDSSFQDVVFLRVRNQNVFTHQSSLLEDQTTFGITMLSNFYFFFAFTFLLWYNFKLEVNTSRRHCLDEILSTMFIIDLLDFVKEYNACVINILIDNKLLINWCVNSIVLLKHSYPTYRHHTL